ncbi:MAG: ATP-binding cassette domain-containing protein [Porticoccus sp.]
MTLQLQQIQFHYPHQDFGLGVPELIIQPGESVALVGPSGSGKTTLLNLIAGILKPNHGNITLNNNSLLTLGTKQQRQYRLRHMGMIFQSFELLDYLDVKDNILLQARLCSDTKVDKKLTEQALHIASELGLRDKWQKNIQTLSQGERQRVAVCRALLLNPQLVLADEPTGNLDPENKVAVLDQLINKCKQQHCILLTVTHDHSLLPSFDRVIDIATLTTQSNKSIDPKNLKKEVAPHE